jgi:hypothetical protein
VLPFGAVNALKDSNFPEQNSNRKHPFFRATMYTVTIYSNSKSQQLDTSDIEYKSNHPKVVSSIARHFLFDAENMPLQIYLLVRRMLCKE